MDTYVIFMNYKINIIKMSLIKIDIYLPYDPAIPLLFPQKK